MEAGGKGASLCRMHRYGLPVPEGFIICGQLFKHFMETTGLFDKVVEMIDQINYENYRDLLETSRKIREMVYTTYLPDALSAGILEMYRKLGNTSPVAVRSSGTAEDLADASFAGQQETFLYVIGEKDLLHYVKECWASLYNDRAIFYRREKGFSEKEISIAVVVQRMVNAEKAGVMFSANPISGCRNSVMIEAAYGLGEGVVQGIVTPDSYVIEKGTFHIDQELVSEKECMVVRYNEQGGVKEVPVPEAIREAPVLSRDELYGLVNLCVKVENFYGTPQDLEWAIEGDGLYLLQSRPITTLKS